MRLWLIHPKYLDAKGLVALWREALLAQSVLTGRTTGYRHHPQLDRFRAMNNPEGAIASYLRGIAKEAGARRYAFDAGKIRRRRINGRLPVTVGQVAFERSHLAAKLAERDREKRAVLATARRIDAHPLFYVIPGAIESWEKTGKSA